VLERDLEQNAEGGSSGQHDVLAARAAQVATSIALGEDARREAPGGALAVPAVLVGLLAAFLAAVAWWPAFAWLSGRWFDDHGYYGHGPLVPLVALALLWRARARAIPASDRAGIVAGGWVLASAVLLQGAAAALRVHFMSGVALWLAVIACSLLLGGAAFTRTIAFPLGFLGLALPLPMEWIARASLELKLLAAEAATAAIGACGITAVREGSAIHLSQGDVMVDDACSGLRSLLALLTMGVLVSGLDRGVPFARRALVVALALPVAIAANAWRVAFLGLLVHFEGAQVLETWIHEGSGYVVYAISLGLLLLARKLVATPRPETSRSLTGARAAAPGARRVVAGIALALVPCAAATLLLDRKPSVLAPPIATSLPASIGSWTATDLPIEDYVRKILDTNDLISRRYARPGEEPVYLYIAASRGDRKVAHPPEVCAPGNGYLVEDHEELELARGVRAVRFMLVRGADRQLIVYFYAAGTWLGPSYLGSQLRAALERFRSPDVPCALVRMSAPVRDAQSPDEVWGSIRRFALELVPELRVRLGEGKR
jgi:EpsI family protein